MILEPWTHITNLFAISILSKCGFLTCAREEEAARDSSDGMLSGMHRTQTQTYQKSPFPEILNERDFYVFALGRTGEVRIQGSLSPTHHQKMEYRHDLQSLLGAWTALKPPLTESWTT